MNSSEGSAAEGIGKAEEVQNNGSREEGVLRFDPDNLPLGYRFCPTDTELLVYLTRKIHRQPLPPNNIAQVNLYAHHPEQLAGRYKAQGEKEWYYFTPRERKYTNGQRPKRSIEDGDGYWKATGAEQEIKSLEEGTRKIIIGGYKRALVFYRGKHLHGVKTNWIMHEFRLAALPPPTSTDHDIVNDNIKRFDDYVLCRVYKNNRSDGGSKRSRDVQPRNIDIASTSTSSSKIPKVVDQDSHDETENDKVTAASGGGGGGGGGSGTEYMEENPTENGSYINHQTLQNQHQQQQQQPIVGMPQIPSAYTTTTSVLPHNYLQVLNLPPAGADVFWHAHNNSKNLMQSSDFTNVKGPWEMSTDFYSKNVCNASGLICSDMDLNPGGDMGGCGCYTANSNIITSTTMPMPMPMLRRDLKSGGYMPCTGDMWRNTCNPNIDSPTLPMPMGSMNPILDTPLFTPNDQMTCYHVLKIRSNQSVRSVEPSIDNLFDLAPI